MIIVLFDYLRTVVKDKDLWFITVGLWASDSGENFPLHEMDFLSIFNPQQASIGSWAPYFLD